MKRAILKRSLAILLVIVSLIPVFAVPASASNMDFYYPDPDDPRSGGIVYWSTKPYTGHTGSGYAQYSFEILPGVRIYEIYRRYYDDIPVYNDLYGITRWLNEEGIMLGIKDTGYYGSTFINFDANKPVTRAMMVTVLWRMAGRPSSSCKIPFTDCVKDSYYYTAVKWAYEHGITTGTSATKFSPNDNVYARDALTFFYRFGNEYTIDQKGDFVSGNYTFKQGAASSYPKYSRSPAAWAYAKGYISKNLIGIEYASRGFVASIAYKMLRNDYYSIGYWSNYQYGNCTNPIKR